MTTHECTAVERWRAIVDRRADQTDAAYAALGRTSDDFWDRRAATFHRATRDRTEGDPLLERLLGAVTGESSVLDVGAGTGRFTCAVAPHVRRVIAVEPNPRMRDFLEREVRERGLTNVEVVASTWEEAAADLRADVVVGAHVLYPIRDIVPFVRKLDVAMRQHAFVYLRAVHPDAVTSPLWALFHAEVRRVGPNHLAALAVLGEMGIYADVEVVHQPVSFRWDDLHDAVAEQMEALILPDTTEVREQLERVLRRFLRPLPEGGLALPVETLPNAIVSWRPSARVAERT